MYVPTAVHHCVKFKGCVSDQKMLLLLVLCTAAVKGRREKMRSQIVINTQRHKLEPNVSADKS